MERYLGMEEKKNRTKAVVLRFSDDEYKILREKCGHAVFAKWCRSVLLGAEVTKVIKPKAKPADSELLKELNKISVNVNQIAKVLNTSEMLNQQLKTSQVLKLLLTFENINVFINEVMNDTEAIEE